MKGTRCRTIMVQGTGSHVGKSIMVAALCRIFRQDGYRVAPFKSQNMALNSCVTKEGLEMGRAQVTQAEAAGIEPTVDMNPILLKPVRDTVAQVIVRGRPVTHMSAKRYFRNKPRLTGVIRDSFRNLAERHDIIVIEGAGSPAEINLRKGDIVNMKVAEMFDSPVLLVGDINLGGVFAWIKGTLDLLTPRERARVRGVIINKFRGDLDILKPGITMLERRIRKPVLGVVPYFHDIRIPEEDSLPKEIREAGGGQGRGRASVKILPLPHISNFTDFDPLFREPEIAAEYVRPGDRIGDADCIIIPGTKNTIGDLKYLIERGYAAEIAAKAKEGACVVGICGGYQMMGEEIADPRRIETGHGRLRGLKLLPVRTVMAKEKTTHRVFARDRLFGTGLISGYEIHNGVSERTGRAGSPFTIRTRSGAAVSVEDGATVSKGRIFGTYLHGIFENDAFRKAFIRHISKNRPRRAGDKAPRIRTYQEYKEKEYDKLAHLVREHIDIKEIYRILER